MYCQNCGCELSAEAKFCPECGMSTAPGAQPGRSVNQNAMASAMMNKKSEIGALLMSVITGLGHMYVGKTVKGVILLLAQILSFMVMIFVMSAYGVYYTSDTVLVAGALGWFGIAVLLMLYGMYDAYREAKAYNEYLLMNAGMRPY